MSASFFALFDDIAILMDDVAMMSQVAGKKTAGILGDDLAVSANKAAGFTASRELPVLWKITKGSFVNKLIILPIAFLMSAFVPWLIIPILMLGGVYLAYEGAEKIHEYFFHKKEKISKITTLESKSKEEIVNHEQEKIKSAIFIDFILSVEIIIIALSTVTEKALPVQIIVVSLIALLATVGVYGLVALIVRMDDLGYSLIALNKGTKHIVTKIGQLLVASLPKVIKSLTVIGTIAMLLVAGEIFLHNTPALHQILHTIPDMITAVGIGLIVGFLALFILSFIQKIFMKN